MSNEDIAVQRALEAERQVAFLSEQLRAAEQRDREAAAQNREAAAQNRALQAQIRQLTALVKGMQKQLAELLRAQAAKDKPTKDKAEKMAAEADGTAAPSTPGKTADSPSKQTTSAKSDLPPPPADRKKPETPPQKPIRRADPAPDAEHDVRNIPVDSCRKCGSDELTQVGCESAKYVQYIRAHVRVVEEVRDTCRCRDCGAFTTAPKPPTAVIGGVMSPSTLAHVAYGKGVMHLPLSRIADDLRLLGADFAKGTMSDAMKHISNLVGPVVDAITDELFASGVLWFDGSGVKVLQPGEKGTHYGQITVFSNADAAVYRFSATKHGEHAAKFLRLGTNRAYRGYLHADAASNANLLYKDGTIIECGCWYHARDMFAEARASAPDDAEAAIAWIAALFEVEHEADDAGDTPEQRLERRRRDARPIIDGFLSWAAEAAKRYLPDEDLPKAVRYVRNQFKPLTRFFDDGRIHLTNNRAERDLGPLGRGRKAWLHAGSDGGGHRLADVYTIVETCRRQDLDPFEYLVDVLPLLSTMPANRGRSAAKLTPSAWKASPGSRGR